GGSGTLVPAPASIPDTRPGSSGSVLPLPSSPLAVRCGTTHTAFTGLQSMPIGCAPTSMLSTTASAPTSTTSTVPPPNASTYSFPRCASRYLFCRPSPVVTAAISAFVTEEYSVTVSSPVVATQ